MLFIETYSRVFGNVLFPLVQRMVLLLSSAPRHVQETPLTIASATSDHLGVAMAGRRRLPQALRRMTSADRAQQIIPPLREP